MKPTQVKAMTSEEIKQAIADEGYTLSMVADALGVNLGTVSGLLGGHNKSHRIAKAICTIIKKPMNEVFPDVIKSRRVVGEERVAKVNELRQLLAS